MHPWARRNIPQLAGRLALVTGANSGLLAGGAHAGRQRATW